MWRCGACGICRAIPVDRRGQEHIHARALYAWAFLKHRVACANEMLSCPGPQLQIQYTERDRTVTQVPMPPDIAGMRSAWQDPDGVVPILGLDVDGVLDNLAHRVTVQSLPRERNFVFEFRRIVDLATVARLDAVVRDTGALVLLMSAWRKFLDGGVPGTCHARVGDIPLPAQKAFQLAGFRGVVYDTTPTDTNMDRASRNREVRQWLRGADLGQRVRLVMVDDSYGDGDLLSHLIQTTHRDGWTDETTSQVMAAFNNPEFDLDPKT